MCDVQRGKRRLREKSENAKRRHPGRNLGSAEQPQFENGDVEAVTLFEVVTMGKSAMQVSGAATPPSDVT